MSFINMSPQLLSLFPNSTHPSSYKYHLPRGKTSTDSHTKETNKKNITYKKKAPSLIIFYDITRPEVISPTQILVALPQSINCPTAPEKRIASSPYQPSIAEPNKVSPSNFDPSPEDRQSGEKNPPVNFSSI